MLTLTAEGHIFSFGIGQSGTLGHGKNVTVQLKPLRIEIPGQSQTRFSRIFAGESHCVALSTDGRVFSWGYGGDGRLGHGDCQSLFYPTVVVNFESIGIRDVSCGQDYTFFVGEEGNVFGCGSLKNGKLGLVQGQGEPPFIMVPRLVGLKCPQFKKIVEIRANSFHSMAVSYDVLPDANDSQESQGGILLTFGQNRMGVG